MGYEATGSGSLTIKFTPDTDQRQMRDVLLNRYDELCAEELAQRGEDSRQWVEADFRSRKHELIRYDDPFWWLTVVLHEVGFHEVDRGTGNEGLRVELSFYDKYDEAEILGLLNTLVPYTQEGCISYTGEEDDHWRHVFSNGQWIEQSGQICYEEPKPEPYPPFEKSCGNMRRLIAEIRRQVIYNDQSYDEKARALLAAFDGKDPDGVLQALTGRSLYELGLAAGVWKAADADDHTVTEA